MHLELDDVLAVSMEETNTEVTNALKNAGANIAHVPQSVFKLLSECEYGRWLSRQTVKEELIVSPVGLSTTLHLIDAMNCLPAAKRIRRMRIT